LNKSDITPQLAAQLQSEGVDLDRVFRLLDDLNAGKYNEAAGIEPDSVPDLSNPSIIDRRGPASYTMSLSAARDRFKAFAFSFPPESLGCPGSPLAGAGAAITFDAVALEKIGVHLYPKTAYGVLNGGSASSYADIKKNKSLDENLFAEFRGTFEPLAEGCRGKPKGITPAFINPDGTPGASFLLLKLRMLLEHKRKYRELVGPLPDVILPAFQMTSVQTDAPVSEAFRSYLTAEELKPLAEELGCSPLEVHTAIQPMMAAITHSSEGSPRRLFDRAYGKPDTGIAMPGGHGQNFEILTPVYRKLYEQGIRYAWLGNIDNMGYTVDPVSLAIFALSGKDAAFEESWRTPMDVKGGILVCDQTGRLSCADIGPVISTKEMLAFEEAGKPILFNCGIGLFDLEKLVSRLPSIPHQLPLRVTDQDKDAGRYAQAEQITWEIIGLLDDPLFFAVEKPVRFIAAKMLMETILTSLPPEAGRSPLGDVSREIHKGLVALLEREYGLALKGGRWVPAR
jgi:UDP-N-acetylglucosamine pyrophosphorylase